MGIMSGSLTVRRYRVAGDVPDDFRTRYAEALDEYAFKAPASSSHEGEVLGWCQVHNLLDTSFERLDKWLYNHYAVAALRIDKKSVPAKLFKATLDKRIEAWCQENGRQKAPASVRSDIKDALKADMLSRTLPRVAAHEWCWNIVDGWVIFHNTSERANDMFRTLFRQTFGLALLPFSPLDFLADAPELAGSLELEGTTDLRLPGIQPSGG